MIGQHFSFDQLYRLADVGEMVGLTGLDELLAGRFLVELNAPDSRYAFAHDQIRSVVYTEAGAARRRVLHRRALELLAGDLADTALAHHALQAGEIPAALCYSLAAGAAALRLFALRDAIAHYEQAQTLIQSAVATPQSAVVSLYLQLGRAYELRGDYDQAQVAYQTLLTWARQENSPAAACQALNRLATLAAQNGRDLARARALLAEAQQVAGQRGDQSGLAETLWNLATTGSDCKRPTSIGFGPATGAARIDRALLQHSGAPGLDY